MASGLESFWKIMKVASEMPFTIVNLGEGIITMNAKTIIMPLIGSPVFDWKSQSKTHTCENLRWD